ILNAPFQFGVCRGLFPILHGTTLTIAAGNATAGDARESRERTRKKASEPESGIYAASTQVLQRLSFNSNASLHRPVKQRQRRAPANRVLQCAFTNRHPPFTLAGAVKTFCQPKSGWSRALVFLLLPVFPCAVSAHTPSATY